MSHVGSEAVHLVLELRVGSEAVHSLLELDYVGSEEQAKARKRNVTESFFRVAMLHRAPTPLPGCSKFSIITIALAMTCVTITIRAKAESEAPFLENCR